MMADYFFNLDGKRIPVKVIDSTKERKDGEFRRIESYPPDERDNPNPGVFTIEVFDPKLAGKNLKTAMQNELLHHMPSLSPEFQKQKTKFISARSLREISETEDVYNTYRERFGERRPMDVWLDRSFIDQRIGAAMRPMEDQERQAPLTPVQQDALKAMQKLMPVLQEVIGVSGR